MADIKISPVIRWFPDADRKYLIIEIELPGVKKENIRFVLYENSFFVNAIKEGVNYMGSYVLPREVKPEKASGQYYEGLLKILVPYKEPFEEGIELKIE